MSDERRYVVNRVDDGRERPYFIHDADHDYGPIAGRWFESRVAAEIVAVGYEHQHEEEVRAAEEVLLHRKCAMFVSATTSCDEHEDPWDCPDALILMVPGFGWVLPIRDGGRSFIPIKRCPFCGDSLPVGAASGR